MSGLALNTVKTCKFKFIIDIDPERDLGRMSWLMKGVILQKISCLEVVRVSGDTTGHVNGAQLSKGTKVGWQCGLYLPLRCRFELKAAKMRAESSVER